MLGIVLVLVALSLVLAFQGVGRYAAARYLGLSPVRLEIGIGPELHVREVSGGELAVCLVPLGVWPHMEEEARPRTAAGKLVLGAAGPLACFAGAFVLFFAVVAVFGLPGSPALVEDVIPGSPAALAGVRPGDRIVEVNGRPVRSWERIDQMTEVGLGEPLELVAARAGERVSLHVVPVLLSSFSDREVVEDRYVAGLVFQRVVNQEVGAGRALIEAGLCVGHVVRIAAASVYWSVGGTPGDNVFSGASRYLGVKSAFGGSLAAAWLFAVAALSVLFALLGLVPVPGLNPLNGREVFGAVYQAALRREPGPRAVAVAGLAGLGILLVILGLAVASSLR